MHLWIELRQAWARLRRSMGYTLSCVLILAAGIGLSLFMFSALNGFILKPLPFTDGERLVHLELARSQDPGRSSEPSIHDYLDLRREQRVLNGLHAYSEATINISDGVRPERHDGAMVSGELFAALGLQPQLGRNFSAADEQPGAAPVVMIGHAVWQQRFAGAADVVGRSIRVNGRPATIIGVMPEGFRFPRMHQVWTLLDLQPDPSQRSRSLGVEIFGHLAPGESLASAREHFAQLIADLAQRHPDSSRGDLAVVKPFAEEFISPITRSILYTLFAAVVLVLLMACANVANLMLARGGTRARELALRSAIGAGSGRLVVGVVLEALLIAMLAAPLGWAGAAWGAAQIGAVIADSPDPPVYWATPALDGLAWLFVVGTSVLATLAAGLYPAWRAAGMAKAPALRDGGYGSTGRRAGRLSRALVLTEIAACAALLTAAGLALRSVQEIQAMPTGVRFDGVLTGRIGLFESRYPQSADRIAFVESLQQRLQALPGVQQAALASAVPLQGTGRSEILLEGEALSPAGQRGPAWFESIVTPGYFEVFDVPLLAGRDFRSSDRPDSQPVVIVSQSLAARLWPGRDPLGQRIKAAPRDPDSPWLTVIGVVGDVRMGAVEFGLMRNAGPEQFYRPYTQFAVSFLSPVLRVDGPPQGHVSVLRDAVAAADPDLPVYWLRSMQDWLDIVLFDIRLLARLFGIFAVVALALASAGLYAVLAQAVSQRTREIGVRQALGASRANVAELVARQSAGQLLAGLVCGGLLGLGFGKALSSVLYGVGSFDPATFLGVCVVLAGAAVLATWLPTRRALSIEPIRALQQD